MPTKTLLIGLGSKGSDMVSRAVERVYERHAGLEDVPWLKVLAIDTAPISGEPGQEAWRLAATGNVVGIGLPGNVYAQFTEKPASLNDMDYLQWADKDVFARTGSSVNGASGVRMIGRGSLLHPESFAKVYGAIEFRLNALANVDLDAEIAARKLPPLPQGANPNVIRVVACGALTGGTSSGSFIDLGYLLQAMGGFGSYSVYGVFSIPHPDCGKPAPMANAYTALRELNHYLSDGVRYRQRVPLKSQFPKPIAPPAGTAPYQGTMIVMAKTGQDADIEPMHESVAEFLYLAACSDLADSTFKKIVDPAAQYTNLRFHGTHMRFQTFGTASMVFPAEHIARGASAKLASDALLEWLNKPELPVADGLTHFDRLGFNLRGIRSLLLQPEQGRKSVEETITEKVATAHSQAIANNLDYRQLAEQQIDDGFASFGPVEGTIGARIVPQTIESNKVRVRDQWLARFKEEVDRAVLDLGRVSTAAASTPDRGPNYAIGLCKAIIERIRQLRIEISDSSAHTAVSTARTAMEAAWAELERANSPVARVALFARFGREIAAEAWHQSAITYYQQRLHDECGRATAECLDAWERFAKRTLLRLDGKSTDPGSTPSKRCLVEVAKSVQAVAAARYDQAHSTPPRLNGHAVFTPGKTIDAEHSAAMSAVEETDREGFVPIDPSRVDEAYARAWLIRSWALLHVPGADPKTDKGTFSITMDGTSRFDPSDSQDAAAGIPQREAEAELDRMVQPALARFYESLASRDVLKEVYRSGQQAASATVQAVIEAAEPFMPINDEGPLGVLTSQDPRAPSFAFFVNAKAKTAPYSDFAGELRSRNINEHVEIPDRIRAVVIKTRTTFAASNIVGLHRLAHQEEQLRGHEANSSKSRRSPFESRRDVAWKTLDGSPIHPNIRHRMALVLFGLAVKAIVPENEELVVQTNTPGRRLDIDLEKAGLSVCHDHVLSAYLENALEAWAKPSDSGELAAKVHDFVLQFDTLYPTLEYQGLSSRAGSQVERQANVDKLRRWFEDLLLELLEKDALDALQAYDKFINPNEPKPKNYRRAAGEARANGKTISVDGYYCPSNSCEEFLGEVGKEDQLPMQCRNCGESLFQPGWQRRWKVSALAPGYTQQAPGFEVPSQAVIDVSAPPKTETARPIDDV